MQIMLRYWIKIASTFMMEKQPKLSYQKRKCSVGTAQIPLKKNVQNFNADTLMIQRPSPNEAISHVFELLSTKKTIAYYHTAAGFNTKETWTDAIQFKNYDTWTGLNVKSVNKYFLEIDETQKVI